MTKGKNLIFIGHAQPENCDGCLYLEIDAKSGNVIGKGKIVYQYKQQPTLHQQ